MGDENWANQGLVWIFFFFFYHSSLITQFPSLITHHLKYPILFGIITQYFSTVCGPHTCHLVKAKLFCGPHHFLFSHFPSFTPVTLPKHKPELSFNHNNKNINNNNNNNNNNKPEPSFNHNNKNSNNNNNNSSSNNNNNKTNPNLASTTITKTTTTKCGQ